LKLLEDVWIWEVPNSTAYVSAMRACEQAGQWQCCLSLLSEMSDFELPPDRRLIEVPIKACQDAGQWEHATRLLGRLQSAEAKTTESKATGRPKNGAHGKERAHARHNLRTIPATTLGVDRLPHVL